jgi:hypothetical protein
LGQEERVAAAAFWLLENPEEGCAWGLEFVRLDRCMVSTYVEGAAVRITYDVGVPAGPVGTRVKAEVLAVALMFGIAIN